MTGREIAPGEGIYMSEASPSVPDVFTVREIARAAAVSSEAVQDLVDAGEVGTIDGRYIALADAVRTVTLLRGRGLGLFRSGTHFKRSPGGALAASAGLHLAMPAAIAFLTTLTAPTNPTPVDHPPRLVFLATPGPGGGGGGGGLRQPAPPARAKLKGTEV